MNVSICSSLIAALKPERFKEQDYYASAVEKIVEEASATISECAPEGAPKIFHELLENFGDQRHEIAKVTCNEDVGVEVSQFGTRRVISLNPINFSTVPLDLVDAYKTSGCVADKYIFSNLKKRYGQSKAEKQFFIDRSVVSFDSPKITKLFANRQKARKVISHLSSTDRQRILNAKTQEEIDDPRNKKIFNQLLKLNTAAVCSVNYIESLEDNILMTANGKIPLQEGARLATAEVLFMNNKKKYVLSTYLKGLPSENVKRVYDKCSPLRGLNVGDIDEALNKIDRAFSVTWAPTEPINIPVLLERAEKAFVRALSSDTEEDLTHHVGHMRFWLAHAHPFIRGSAAVSEWLEQSVYRAKGYKITYNEEMADLKAISVPSLRLFSSVEYPQTFSLEQL
ncbi:hypothetical protein SCG7109_AD_00440 [Chlamydiales bacterium SCGC AG-110-M15]|nr:hypothetical protein SCG7109_AD_00440 [Chlamydiales bacterium SCGC AG-110-M15]